MNGEGGDSTNSDEDLKLLQRNMCPRSHAKRTALPYVEKTVAPQLSTGGPKTMGGGDSQLSQN